MNDADALTCCSTPSTDSTGQPTTPHSGAVSPGPGRRSDLTMARVRRAARRRSARHRPDPRCGRATRKRTSWLSTGCPTATCGACTATTSPASSTTDRRAQPADFLHRRPRRTARHSSPPPAAGSHYPAGLSHLPPRRVHSHVCDPLAAHGYDHHRNPARYFASRPRRIGAGRSPVRPISSVKEQTVSHYTNSSMTPATRR